MKRETIFDVIARDLTGKPKKDDSGLLGDWIKNEKSNYLIYKIIRDYFVYKKQEDTSDASFSNLKARINNGAIPLQPIAEKKSLKKWAWLKYAAIFILALGLTWTSYNIISPTREILVELLVVEKSNPNGQKTYFRLPDGTMVNLNAGSSLKYTDDTENNRRLLNLSGEAFFEVAKDPNKPFVVISGNVSTLALGTAFNVKAYADEGMIKVSLIEGKVQVEAELEDRSEKLVLDPGMGALYSIDNNKLEIKAIDEETELAWKEKIIVFKNARLPYIITELERWYGVKIEVINMQKSGEWNYTGKFKNQTLDHVLKTMGDVKRFKYAIEDKEVTITFY